MTLARTLAILLIATLAHAGNWPAWRGPTADGIVPASEKNLPVEWDAKKNVAWRVPLPGLGTSTPIVWDNLVILTSQIGDGPFEGRARDNFGGPKARRSGVADRVQFSVDAFFVKDGASAWKYVFDAEGDLPPVHSMHNLASPSCVTDGTMVYAWVATGQLVALNMQGKLVWTRHLGKEYKPFFVLWGHGSSPLLYKDRLILLCDHQETAYLLALDKTTGAQAWKVDRGRIRSYTTPFVIPGPDGDQLVINSEKRIDVYNAKTGELVWYFGPPSQAVVPTPVVHDGILYTSRGYTSGPYFAVATGGKGDAGDRVKWEVKTGAPYVSSLLYYGGVVYMSAETGVASAIDAGDGKTLWKERLGGVFTASPVAADGKVYMLNDEGETFVLAAGREFRVIARNKLEERILASPAISNGRIFLRGDNNLICIGASKPATSGTR